MDVRDYGSGNAGATNTFRVLGKQIGVIVLFMDIVKGVTAASLVHYLSFVSQGTEQFINLQLLFGLLAVVGHIFPVFENFKGGKGIATSAGVLIAFIPFGTLILILIFILTYKITRYISVASMVAAASLPFTVIYGSWKHDKFADGTWNRPLLIFAVFIALMAIWKHRSNIKNIIAGKEHKFTSKNKG